MKTEESDKVKSRRTRIIMIVVGLIIIGSFTAMFVPVAPSESYDKNAGTNERRQVALSQAMSGTIDIDDIEWQGKTCLDGSKRIDVRMIQPNNVYWQIRLDKDDSRVYTLFPNNAPGNRHLELKNYNVLECRIAPNQTTTKGVVAWEISPRRS